MVSENKAAYEGSGDGVEEELGSYHCNSYPSDEKEPVLKAPIPLGCLGRTEVIRKSQLLIIDE